MAIEGYIYLHQELTYSYDLTGYTECLDPHIEIVVPDDDHGLYAIDILDPSWVSRNM